MDDEHVLPNPADIQIFEEGRPSVIDAVAHGGRPQDVAYLNTEGSRPIVMRGEDGKSLAIMSREQLRRLLSFDF